MPACSLQFGVAQIRLFVHIHCEIIISCFQILQREEKSLVEKDGKGLEQFGGLVEVPVGVVPQHLHQQERGEEGTSTTTTQTKAESPQEGEERKKTAEEGGEKGRGSSGTSRTNIAGRKGKND